MVEYNSGEKPQRKTLKKNPKIIKIHHMTLGSNIFMFSINSCNLSIKLDYSLKYSIMYLYYLFVKGWH